MLTIEHDSVIVDQESTKLVGFRLEDTNRAPAIIVFVDQNKPELLPIPTGQEPPTKIRSKNMVADIQIITYAEINAFLENH